MIMLAPNEIPVVYRRYGGVREMWHCLDADVLLDGPAGTGKSRGILEMMVRDAIKYPGSRQAIVRKTRVSLTDSALVTLETKVLHDVDAEYLIEPLMGGPTRATRHIYNFKNGSEIACHGMDNPTRLFSTEYDRIYVQEATELSEDEWESLHRALRNNVMSFQQLIGDCNPDAEYHWLNQRCLAGKTRRIYSRHKDNPSITPEYLKRLSNLTGVRRKRLFLGLWCAAEGQIWENYDPATHIIDGELTQRQGDRRWMLYVPKWGLDTIELTWFFASHDWGFRNPGCMGIWGVDKDRRAFLVNQVYQSGRNHDWWANKAEALRQKYDIQRFNCDPEDAAGIDLFNQRMGKVGGHWIARPVEKKPNDFGSSASIARERLENGGVFFLRGNLESRDPELIEAKKPCSLEEEIHSYVYREVKDGQAVKEEEAPDSDDHGCDMFRYAMMFLDRNDWQPAPQESQFRSGSYGKLLGHDKVLQRIKERQYA